MSYEAVIEKIYGNEEGSPQKKKAENIRCCEHPETDGKFCPQCGKPVWEQKVYNEEYEKEVRQYFYEKGYEDDKKKLSAENFYTMIAGQTTM